MPTPLTTCLLALAGVTTALNPVAAVCVGVAAVLWQVTIQARVPDGVG